VRPTLPLLALLAACGSREPDLAAAVPPGEVVAGVVDTEDALFAGSAAEGRIGDVLLKNAVARFVVQAPRADGHYYEPVGGGIIDADVARPAGVPGRDPVDEWTGMFGLGRISEATAVEVVEDGRDGVAIVRVTAREAPLTLFTGSLEDPGLVPDLGLDSVTDYILRPDTPLLEVRTTLTAGPAGAELAVGDVLQGGLEVLEPWDPGVGLQAPGDDTRRFTAYLGQHDEGAWAIVPPPGETAGTGGGGLLLQAVGDLLATFEEPAVLGPGASLEHVR
jgi:hypothetical protein